MLKKLEKMEESIKEIGEENIRTAWDRRNTC